MPIWTALSASVRGALHERNGQVNQDSVALKNPVVAADALYLAVADGHGSARSFRSALGSALATECALQVLSQFVRWLGPDAPLSRVRHQAKTAWPRALINSWKSAVRANITQTPFSFLDFAAFPEPPPVIKPDEELPHSAYLAYGATLLALAVTRHYIIYSQLGDGDILTVYADGHVARPLPRAHQYYANETISLCTSRAAKEFQVRVVPIRAGAPAMIMLSTDGYANCFGDDFGFHKVGGDMLTYLRQHGVGFVRDNLQSWLNESSRDGSGDDITVGLATRSRFETPALEPVEARVEENPPGEP